jgi:predicted Zn-dependent protease
VSSPHSAKLSAAVDARERRIHRELLQLVMLIAMASGAFFVTRALAAHNHDTNARDAAEWFRRGQAELHEGRVADAIEAFHRARARNRDDTTYSLALAHALAATRQDAAARRVLLTLREATPEDAGINLELARLSAADGDGTQAVRYYHNALYAPWAPENEDTRRAVRMELIQLLLRQGEAKRADAELLALSAEMPDDHALHAEVGRLFEEAGDHQHAAEHFAHAAAHPPRRRTAR